jgi:hypothetical protein
VNGLRAGSWLGDAAEAFDALGLTSHDEARKIASMLGLEFAERPEIPAQPDVEPSAFIDAAEPTSPASTTVTESGITRLRNLSVLALPPLEPVGSQPPDEASTEQQAPVLSEDSRSETLPSLPFRPLLRSRTAASVVTTAIRTWGPGSRIDERRTVAELARGRAIREFPRRPRLSVYRGVQVLVDLAEAMDPYGRDQQHVVDLVQRVVGREITMVGSFENCPSRGVWMLPRAAAVRGRPVLVLTDLGLGGPQVQPARASVDEWRRYARGLARAGSSVIALVPYPVDEARRVVGRRIATVPWDRASVSTVQQARRSAS